MGMQSHATLNIRPRQKVYSGLHHAEGLCSAYSINCIAATCYNIQVTNYCEMAQGSPPIAMHVGCFQGTSQT
jgi:hypothetical protein